MTLTNLRIFEEYEFTFTLDSSLVFQNISINDFMSTSTSIVENKSIIKMKTLLPNGYDTSRIKLKLSSVLAQIKEILNHSEALYSYNNYGYTPIKYFSEKFTDLNFENKVIALNNLKSTINLEGSKYLAEALLGILSLPTDITYTLDIEYIRTVNLNKFSPNYNKKKDLFDALAHRYAVLDRPSGVRNTIMDSFLPQEFIRAYGEIQALRRRLTEYSPKASGLISRGMANILGYKKVPIEDLIEMVGYTPTKITKLLKEVKAKKLQFIFVGLGGTGMNTMHWLTEMCELCNITGLFKKVYIYEPDIYTIDNLFRFPNDWTSIISAARTFEDHLRLDMQNLRISPKGSLHDALSPYYRYKTDLITKLNERCLSDTNAEISHYNLDPRYFYNSGRVSTDIVAYGAPNVETRQMFEQLLNGEEQRYRYYRNPGKIPLITATHGNDDCSVDINPTFEGNGDLVMANYGIIQIGVFYMNQIRMAISLLETLAKYSHEELCDLRNHRELEYSFPNEPKKGRWNIAYQQVNIIHTTEEIQQGE